MGEKKKIINYDFEHEKISLTNLASDAKPCERRRCAEPKKAAKRILFSV